MRKGALLLSFLLLCLGGCDRGPSTEQVADAYGLASGFDPTCEFVLAVPDTTRLPEMVVPSLHQELERVLGGSLPWGETLPSEIYLALRAVEGDGYGNWAQAIFGMRDIALQARFATLGGSGSLLAGGASALQDVHAAGLRTNFLGMMMSPGSYPPLVLVIDPDCLPRFEAWLKDRGAKGGTITLRGLMGISPDAPADAFLDGEFACAAGALPSGHAYLSINGGHEGLLMADPEALLSSAAAMSPLLKESPIVTVLAGSKMVHACRKLSKRRALWIAVNRALSDLPNVRDESLRAEISKLTALEPRDPTSWPPLHAGLFAGDGSIEVKAIGGMRPSGLDLQAKWELPQPDGGLFSRHQVLDPAAHAKTWDQMEAQGRAFAAVARALAEARGNGSTSVLGPLELYLPTLEATHAEIREACEAGFGPERLIMADFGGELPELSALGGAGAGMPLPRISVAHPIQNRKSLATGWGRAADAARHADVPFPIFPTGEEGFTDDGITRHGLGLMLLDPDATPGVTLDDKLHVMGTAGAHVDETFDLIREGGGRKGRGAYWSVDIAALRGHLEGVDERTSGQIFGMLPLSDLWPVLVEHFSWAEMETGEREGRIFRTLRLVTDPSVGEE